MEPSSSNGFGSNTYWNRPTSRGRSNRPSRSLSPAYRAPTDSSTTRTRGLQRPTSPLPTVPGNDAPTAKGDPSLIQSSSQGVSHTPFRDMSLHNHMKQRREELDVKDDKAMVKLMKSTLPHFSNEHDWEMAAFELTLVLDRVWPHKHALNITDYLQTTYSHYDRDMEKRADSMIYFALTLSATKDSYAKLQIMAASHPNAIPCVMPNEGKKLYQMFQALFTMTTYHNANLPSMRKQFYEITQKDTESVLQYTSRVDVIVATMAKLGEQVSTGAWIYALGHGLRPEYKDTKDGILYNKDGYETVLSVKTKILSEEAILKDKRADNNQSAKQTVHDEIAMTVAATPPPSTPPTVPIAQFNKGKKGKNGKKGGPRGQRIWNDGNQWPQQPAWSSPPTDNSWAQPLPKGKGWSMDKWQLPPSWPSSGNASQWSSHSPKGKGSPTQKQQLWCDFHQAYGHSTDWCFSNPNRTGGPPKQEWCHHHQSYGHSTEACRKGNGHLLQGDPSQAQPKGGKGKSQGNSRAWKSDNFPASYDQVTPALSETKSLEWWDNDNELSSVCMHDTLTDAHLAILDNDELDEASADLLDLHFLSIIQQHERKQLFLLNPNVALQNEIITHEGYIAFAHSLLVPTQQQITTRFQNLVTYGEHPTNLNAQVMNETGLVNLDVVILQQVNEMNATNLNAQVMNKRA